MCMRSSTAAFRKLTAREKTPHLRRTAAHFERLGWRRVDIAAALAAITGARPQTMQARVSTLLRPAAPTVPTVPTAPAAPCAPAVFTLGLEPESESEAESVSVVFSDTDSHGWISVTHHPGDADLFQ